MVCMPEQTRPAAPRSFATSQVQAGFDSGIAENTAIPSIHQSNGFEFRSLAEARDLFALRKDGNIYSRAANPTVLVFERRVAELEGGIAAAGVASGQAAVALALLALAKQVDGAAVELPGRDDVLALLGQGEESHRDGRDGAEVEHLRDGVRDRLGEERPGGGAHRGRPRVDVVLVDEGDVDAPVREGLLLSLIHI